MTALGLLLAVATNAGWGVAWVLGSGKVGAVVGAVAVTVLVAGTDATSYRCCSACDGRKLIPATFPHDIALSFSGFDRPFAQALRDELERCGHTVFFDATDINAAANIYAAIEQGFRKASFVVALMSNSYMGRSWTQLELSLARDMPFGKIATRRLIPVRLPSFEWPSSLSNMSYTKVDESLANPALDLARRISRRIRRKRTRA